MQAVRAYHNGNPETRESNAEAGNALATSHQVLPLKTPARTMFNTTLLRTNLKENALKTTATLKQNVHASAAGQKHFVYPSTPGLRQSHLGAGRLLLKDNATAGLTFATNTSIMPPLLDLTNKTPFTTRIPHDSSADAKSPPLKMPFLAPSSSIISGLDASPETVIRPSRSRFSLRSPRPSLPERLGQGSNDKSSFQTPDPLGRRNQWDISHGDISISVVGPDVDPESTSECDDEIEYMPPPVAELPYDPGFPMPDYKQLGEELWKLTNVLDLTTLLPYHPPAHLQKFESGDMLADAIASLSLSLETLHEREDDSDDIFLPYKRRQENLRAIGKNPTPTAGTKATTKEIKRTATKGSKSAVTTRPSSSAITSPTSPSHPILKPARPTRTLTRRGAASTVPKMTAKDVQADAPAPAVTEAVDLRPKGQLTMPKTSEATVLSASKQTQTTRIATRSLSRVRNDIDASIPTASGPGPESSGSKIPLVRRSVRSTLLNTATRAPPSERRTRSTAAPKSQRTDPALPVPASGGVRTRAQAAMVAQEPVSPLHASVRKRTTSGTSTKAVPTRPNSRILAAASRRPLTTLTAMRESHHLHNDKESEDEDDEVVQALMIPQTAYLDLLTGYDIKLLA